MDITKATLKAERLSIENDTIAVVYVCIDSTSLGHRHVEYNATLLENYEDDEDCIEVAFSRGKPIDKQYM